MALRKEAFNQKIVVRGVMTGVQRRITRSHVYSTATSVVPNACVFLQELSVTKKFALAITIGRPKLEVQNVHDILQPSPIQQVSN
ncbi:hypothetical protein PIB30_031473 [Stylosanthes scabra]|uniref:Uncharacterized protein n=1 Tax=Stylosanthes scabra TaxID=79078 RepID=A0ABU6VCN2_9FABA|nr:hypothetical protein [Stylosanthes scabra]